MNNSLQLTCVLSQQCFFVVFKTNSMLLWFKEKKYGWSSMRIYRGHRLSHDLLLYLSLEFIQPQTLACFMTLDKLLNIFEHHLLRDGRCPL